MADAPSETIPAAANEHRLELPAEITAPEPECAAVELAEQARDVKTGVLYALASYLWWGFVPLYFSFVRHVPPLEVVGHRIIWCIVFLLGVLLTQRRGPEILAAFRHGRSLMLLTCGATVIAINWFVFIYAVTTEQVLQASLGYYMNPLVNVVLGFTVLGERLRPWQWVSVALAFTGVIISAASGAAFPWIALALAFSFSIYGLLRKLVKVGPMVGLLVETILLSPIALSLIIWTMGVRDSTFSGGTYGLLMLAGIVTAMPLIWFAAAAKRLTLSTVGFMQYIAPSVQFLVAIILLGEAIDGNRLISFAFIWAALAVFSVDSYGRLKRHRRREAIAQRAV